MGDILVPTRIHLLHLSKPFQQRPYFSNRCAKSIVADSGTAGTNCQLQGLWTVQSVGPFLWVQKNIPCSKFLMRSRKESSTAASTLETTMPLPDLLSEVLWSYGQYVCRVERPHSQNDPFRWPPSGHSQFEYSQHQLMQDIRLILAHQVSL